MNLLFAAAGHAHDPVNEVLDHDQTVNSLGVAWRFFEPGGLFEYGLGAPLLQIPITDNYTFVLSKFKILIVVAAVLVAAIYIPMARRVARGELPKGPFWNFFESLLTFIRNEVAKPNLGHDADRFVPFLWSMFLFILFLNLLGLFPFMGSPTACIWVTAGLALVAFVVMAGSAISTLGFGGFLKSFWVHIDFPGLGPVVGVMIWVLEFLGVFIKSTVLAIRLFANMFGGHLVLATLLGMIASVGTVLLVENTFNINPVVGGSLWGLSTLLTVAMVTGLFFLELFIAFLQAFVFVFLTALFTGMMMHPEH